MKRNFDDTQFETDLEFEQQGLTIIIPTWNNPEALLKNIRIIENSLDSLGACEYVGLIIADDGSNADNRYVIEEAIKGFHINIQYMYHENYGLEKNELFLIENTKTKYAMLLGEDDYLPKLYFEKVLNYLNSPEEVGVIVSNFYPVNENGVKFNRSCRNRLRKDRIFENPEYRLIFMAHQMSGLVFQTDGLLEYYKKVPSNVYPQLSFIANSINKGIGVHISDAPFACTVLNNRRFNYSVDGLAYELLKNLIPLPQKERKRLINVYLINWSNQFCNPTSWRSPLKLISKINDYELLSEHERSKLIMTFLLSYLIIPIRLFYRLVIIPVIGKLEMQKIPPIEGIIYR